MKALFPKQMLKKVNGNAISDPYETFSYWIVFQKNNSLLTFERIFDEFIDKQNTTAA